jgi:hypothetical protein
MRSSFAALVLALALPGLGAGCGGGSKGGTTTPTNTNDNDSLLGQKNPDAPFTGAAQPGQPGQNPSAKDDTSKQIEEPPPP